MKNNKKHFIISIIQALAIGLVSSVTALGFNAARTDSLQIIKTIETNIKPAFQGTASAGSSVLSVMDAYKMFNDKKAVFLDARDRNEYEKYHVPGAIHIEPGKTEGKLGKIKAIETELFIAYCYAPGCELAELLAEELKAEGILNIAIMPEGWDGWAGSGYPEEGSMK